MWTSQQFVSGGLSKFFVLNLSHESLVNYYQVNYQLVQNHKYSLTDVELMMPWEREVYVSLLKDQMREEKELRQQQGMN